MNFKDSGRQMWRSIHLAAAKTASHISSLAATIWSHLPLSSIPLWAPHMGARLHTNKCVVILQNVFQEDPSDEITIEHTLERVKGINHVGRTFQREEPHQKGPKISACSEREG